MPPTQKNITEDITAFFNELKLPSRLLGLDLGTKTIGLALSDLNWMIASPFETVARKKFKVDADRLSQIVEAHAVVGFVLGLPRNLNGSEGPRAQSTRAFARNLTGRLPLPILLWDERLTTAAAERTLLEADASRARRAQVVDQLAATLILQNALDARAHALKTAAVNADG